MVAVGKYVQQTIGIQINLDVFVNASTWYTLMGTFTRGCCNVCVHVACNCLRFWVLVELISKTVTLGNLGTCPCLANVFVLMCLGYLKWRERRGPRRGKAEAWGGGQRGQGGGSSLATSGWPRGLA